jgi:antitoxin component of RelBE/YafQ-DinJ toxin-antitoxin module
MSEAINIFLRQSIMHSGIPFTLDVPREQGEDRFVGNEEAVIDALRRYKAVNNNAGFDIALAEPFLQAMQTLGPQAKPRITFYSDAVKGSAHLWGTGICNRL